MISLKDKLEVLLPTVLPADEANAIMANELLDKIADKFPGVSINSLKQNFSILSADPRSCLAKRSGKHGYYLKDKTKKDSSTEHMFRSDFLKSIDTENEVVEERATEVKVVVKRVKAICNKYTELNKLKSGRLHPALYVKRIDL